MPWVKLSDAMDLHPKVAQAGPLGLALQVAALCHCNRFLTDGFVARSVVPKLLVFDGLAFTKDDDPGSQVVGWRVSWPEVVDALVEAGVWEEVEGGWQVHDFLDYQPSKTSVLTEREAARERVAKARATRPRAGSPDVRANTERTPGELREESERSSLYPVPVPDVPSEHSLAAPPATARDPAVPEPKPPRPSDPRFEALAEACGIDWHELTRTSRGQLNAALKDIRTACPDVTPDEIRARARVWPRKFPDATLTPTALAKHWPSLNGARAGPRQCRNCGDTSHGENACPHQTITR